MAISYQQLLANFPSDNKEQKYYKFINNDLLHNNFQYQKGLNIDTINFLPKGSCQPGGLYFTSKKYLHKFIDYGEHIAVIKLCNDAKFYIDPEGYKAKTDKFIINDIVKIEDILNEYGGVDIS
jgi:hypothetical protein